jgi:uncharacterized membrane protein
MSTQANPSGDTSMAVRINRWTLGWARHWLRVVLFVIAIYVALPFVAPTFMRLSWTGAAELLYSLYSPLCHQLAFRSWFLFGEQPAYPRAIANVPGLRPFESYAPDVAQTTGKAVDLSTWTQDLSIAARGFVGDERMGYKVAICERDVAIYAALLLGGLIYAIPSVRRHLRPAPIWLYVLLGILPIGIDGFSQLLSYPPFNLWPVRESSPAFRALTGALFGLMNAWLAFPYLEASARDLAADIKRKFDRRIEREAA